MKALTVINLAHRALVRAAVIAALASSVCAHATEQGAPDAATRHDGVQHPDWAKDAAIYELNLRQFTAEGTLAAAQRQLPRLKALGVGIVWLMPIYPSGKVRAVAPLGSPYAVRDFRTVDPAYGDVGDLRRFVAAAHGLGLHVILDWVGNHSAWDNPLVTEHPEWYTRGAAGTLQSPPWFGWNDVVEFNYSVPDLRRYMTDAMVYWLRVADVDGFRADAAGLIPVDFWETTRAALDRVKPVFMLAEWESRDLSFRAFDMTYAWSWARAMEAIAAGHGSMDELRAYYAWDRRFWPPNAVRMLYVSNHDVIGSGTEFERYGPALDTAVALSVVSEGMPLIFNGQEAGNRRRLSMFAHDPIAWKSDPEGQLYTKLLSFRHQHRALWARPWGGRANEITNDDKGNILSFVRAVPDDAVLVVANLSAAPHRIRLDMAGWPGIWRDPVDGLSIKGEAAAPLAMPSWGYRLLVRQ